jgi:hypothetical protein
MDNTFSFADFSALLDRLKGRENKEYKDLNKNIKNLNKTILSAARQRIPAGGLGDMVAGISAERKTYTTLAQNLRDKIVSPIKKFSSLRGTLDTLGIIKKGTGGIIDQMLEKREAKKEFIEQQLMVNKGRLEDTRENRKALGNKFETQQVLQREVNNADRKIQKLRDAGFTEEQINRTDLVKQRDEKAAQLVASDNRLYNIAKPENRKDREEKLEKNSSKENENEAIKSSEEAVKAQETMASDIAIIKQTLFEIRDKDEKKKPANQTQQNESLFSKVKGWLATAGSVVGGYILSKARGFIGSARSKIGNALKSTGKFLGKAGRAAANTAGGVARFVKNKAVAIGRAGLRAAPAALRAGASLARVATGPVGVAVTSLLHSNEAGKDSDKIPEGAKLYDFEGAKPIQKESVPLTKPQKQNSTAEVVRQTNEANSILKAESAKKDAANNTIVSAPTTNNVKSETNIYGNKSPRNSEVTQHRYKVDKFMR